MPFALYMLALAVFVMGTSEFMLVGLLPAIAADLDVSLGTAGLLTSAFAIGMILGAPLMAAFSRRWPPQGALVVSLLLFAGSHCVGAMTTAFSLLLLSRMLSAVANAGFLAVALSTSTTLVPEDQKGRALSILLSGTTIATVAGVPAGALLGSLWGWRITFWAIVLLCAPAVYGVFRGVPGGAGKVPSPSASPKLNAELRQLADIRVILAMTLAALVNAGTFAFFTYLAPVVTDVAGLPDAWVSVILVVYGVGSFIGVSMSGRLSDTRSGLVLSLGGPLLLAGWIALALVAVQPIALMGMVLGPGRTVFRGRWHTHCPRPLCGFGRTNHGRRVRDTGLEYRSRCWARTGGICAVIRARFARPGVGRLRADYRSPDHHPLQGKPGHEGLGGLTILNS